MVYRVFKKPVRTFKDFAYASFGKTLAEFNIINYTEKVWGISTDELHKDWAGQRISGLNITSVVMNMLKSAIPGKKSGPKSLVDEFWYPETGTGLIYDTIAQKIRDSGRTVALSVEPKKVFHSGGKITSVLLSGGEKVKVDNLVESVHVVDFLKLMEPPPPKRVQEAASKLRYRNQVYLFITLNKDRITTDQWIYFPKPEIPFDRWSEMKNFSEKMSPPGKTSLFIEFFCFEKDPEWKMTGEELFELALPHIAEMGFFDRNDVRHIYKFRGGKDYPIYDLPYKENLAIVKEWLDGFSNLFYIGRPGRFKYTNQDHSLEMGMLAAWSIIEGRRRDIEAVGSEKDYFEKGAAPARRRP
jgi:protoporphyrinogen oxidase